MRDFGVERVNDDTESPVQNTRRRLSMVMVDVKHVKTDLTADKISGMTVSASTDR